MPLKRTFEQLCDDAKSRIREISTDAVGEIIKTRDSVIVIDVREQDEYRAGHLPGARGIGRGILEYHIAEEVPDTDAEIVLYCRGGNRSALAADALQQMGYTRVLSMRGGFRQWDAEARPKTTEGEPIVH
ncbi:MAG: sulfurtransferase [Akkermansiaceae bacterium]|nr:sulfurtransferase [Armatimonadota bacterium]